MSANVQPQTTEPGSIKTYLLVFSTLIFLTFVTVYISVGLDLGAWSLPAALAVATTKALLVLLIFMHVWHEDKLIFLILLVCAFFISLFFGVTMLDVASRGIITEVENNHYYRNSHGAVLVIDVPEHEEPAVVEEAPAEADTAE